MKKIRKWGWQPLLIKNKFIYLFFCFIVILLVVKFLEKALLIYFLKPPFYMIFIIEVALVILISIPFMYIFYFLKKEENVFFNNILSSIDALVIVLDIKGRILYFNSACERTTGYSFKEVKGKYFWDIFLKEDNKLDYQSFFQSKKLEQLTKQVEQNCLMKNETFRLISWFNNIVQEKDGRVKYLICTGIDITEQKKAEELLKKIGEACCCRPTRSRCSS